ncbi:condensation domain-containing protein [Micromonospora sp. WMMD882]|uniref:condensation domain-containing protein n=1 Tax=Micromonospora sp. WMMD882 TaxID=3015151 RepID=UPI00248C66A8|nr:condensation domain-containing protein [Micromonospora sp. WMMD882]WBB78063.1 condensation domain-containing protein [Micromonospora sp. WMMD882]
MTSATASTRPPLSAEQIVFWLASLEGAADSFLTLSVGYRLHGRLDVAALRDAVDRLAAEQDLLRSRVEHGATGPVCAPGDPCRLDVRDLRSFPPDEAERRAQAISMFESTREFPLTSGPFARFRLLQLADTEFVLLVTVHHIALDAESVPVIERRLSAHYRAARTGADVPAPVAGYHDYASEQAALRLTAEAERFWSALLSRPPLPTLRWPGGAAPAADDAPETVHWSELGGPAWEAARRLAERAGSTMHTVLLAAFVDACVTLCGLAPGDEFEVGVPTSMRWDSRWQDVVGPFIHTLPVRLPAGDGPDVLRRVREVRLRTIDLLDHLQVPLSRLHQSLAGDRTAGRARPAVAFQYLDGGEHELDLAGVEVAGYPRPRLGVPPFDLSLVVYRTPDVPRIRIMTNPAAGVTAATATALLATFEQVLLDGAGS